MPNKLFKSRRAEDGPRLNNGVGRKQMRVLVAVAISAILLSGCNCAIDVSVTGSLHEGITFALREVRDIRLAGVWTRDEFGEWEEIWKVEGKDRIDSIRYGQPTAGLSVTFGGEGLKKGRLYTFTVETGDRLWAPCVGNVYLVVTSAGIVETCGTDECLRKYP